MSDYKTNYSNSIKDSTPTSKKEAMRLEKQNLNFRKPKVKTTVDLSETINRFIPETDKKNEQIQPLPNDQTNIVGSKYIINIDSINGYLRVFDKDAKSYCDINGTPSNDESSTYFRIRKRYIKICVALNPNAIKYDRKYHVSYISGGAIKKHSFDNEIAKALEEDNFVTEMQIKIDSAFDLEKQNFFDDKKCAMFKNWLTNRLKTQVPTLIKTVYEIMLEYSNIAVEKHTGVEFDF